MAELQTTPQDGGVGEAGTRGGLFASIGAVGAALLASLCCVGPLLFVAFGIGAGLASTFEPLRPLFTVLTVLFLGIGFYLVYGRSRAAAAAQCAPGASCAVPRRRDKVILWTAVVLAGALWSFVYWSQLFV